mgnify:CR=1 FL=1
MQKLNLVLLSVDDWEGLYVNDIIYESILNCSKILNMRRNLIKKRIESTLEIWKNWQYA